MGATAAIARPSCALEVVFNRARKSTLIVDCAYTGPLAAAPIGAQCGFGSSWPYAGRSDRRMIDFNTCKKVRPRRRRFRARSWGGARGGRGGRGAARAGRAPGRGAAGGGRGGRGRRQ